jgi:lysophosphatidic acid acyltransferase/lysophosphatidylinositol acyltransferase
MQVCIFCEGTRFTTEKYERGCQYARDKGLPVLKHHLFPRTKGFAILAEHLKAGSTYIIIMCVLRQ